MKERPIIMSAPMVSALLADTKTQTRRIVKSGARNMQSMGHECIAHREPGDKWYGDYVWSMRDRGGVWQDFTHEGFIAKCPYGQPGDRLWVRETFWCTNDSDNPSGYQTIDCGSLLSLGPEYATIDYCVNGEFTDPPIPTGSETVELPEGEPVPGYWWLAPPDNWDGESDYHGSGIWGFIPWEFYTKHSSIHIPRWASRILLEITGVRVERLQDISDEDSLAEGIYPTATGLYPGSPRAEYQKLWESINGPGSWGSNPWVWVISFRRIEQ